MENVKINGLYNHFKGIKVKVLMIAKDSEDLKDMVVYEHLENHEIWVRPLSEFISEVDHDKYPDVTQKFRFELIDN